MGRWSQRRRAGGGPPGISGLIEITLATQTAANELTLDYSGDVTAGDFNTADFTTFANNLSPDVINQTASNQLQLQFPVDVTGEGAIIYAGTTLNVLTPQTVPF